MTTIRLHGILAKKFGATIKLYLGNLNQVVSAIDSIKSGFRQELKKISETGGQYCVQRDSDSVVHIVPFLCGFGGFMRALLIIAIVVVVVVITMVSFGVGGMGASTLLTGMTAGTAATTTALSIATALAFNMALGVIFSVLMYKPPTASLSKGNEVSIGGASAGVEAQGKSYVFSNLNNAETQGSSIPLGYGRMKIGSRIINVSIKDYPTNYKFEDETTINQAQSVFSNYLAF